MLVSCGEVCGFHVVRYVAILGCDKEISGLYLYEIKIYWCHLLRSNRKNEILISFII